MTRPDRPAPPRPSRPPPDLVVPLTAEQRRALVRESRLMALLGLVPALPLLLCLAGILLPGPTGYLVELWLAVAVCAAALGACAWMGAAYLRDARAGTALVRTLWLRRRRDSLRRGTDFTFAEDPHLLTPLRDWPEPLPPTPDGAWYRVTYSPHSDTIWGIEAAPGPPPGSRPPG